MSPRLKNYARVLVIALVLATPLLVFAYNVENPASNWLPSYANVNEPKELVGKVINIVLTFAAVLAVLFIIVGGFQYIFSGANEELAETGKKTLKNAIIGLVIIILSYVVVNIISTALSTAP